MFRRRKWGYKHIFSVSSTSKTNKLVVISVDYMNMLSYDILCVPFNFFLFASNFFWLPERIFYEYSSHTHTLYAESLSSSSCPSKLGNKRCWKKMKMIWRCDYFSHLIKLTIISPHSGSLVSARVALSINFNSLQRVHPLSLGDATVDDDAFFLKLKLSCLLQSRFAGRRFSCGSTICMFCKHISSWSACDY